MADPTYAAAIVAQTQTEIRDALLADLAATGSVVGGLPMSSPDRGLVEADAAQLATAQATRAIIGQSATITGAAAVSDAWTDADATWYAVSNGSGGTGRIPAQSAVWSVGLIVAATAAPVTIQPGQILQIQALDSKHNVFQFSGLAAATLNAGSSYKALAQFTARFPGLAADSVASAIQSGTIITSSIAGLSVDISVTPVSVTAARDAETSAALAARCLASWGRLGAGWTRQALDYLIPILAPTVTRWSIDDSNPYGPGTVGITLADATGPASPTEVTEVSSGLNAANVRPLGSGGAIVFAATTYADTITATVAGDGTNLDLQTDIEDALAGLTSALNVLGPFYLTEGFLVALCLGKSFTGTTAFETTAGVYLEVPFLSPGFAGAVKVVSLTTSHGLVGGGSGPAAADVVPPLGVLVVTPAVTVV